MKNKLFLILFMIIIALPLASAYQIVANKVQIDDANIYLSAEPHTMKSSGYVFIEFTSKAYTGNIDVAFGFNSSMTKPKSLEVEYFESVQVPYKNITNGTAYRTEIRSAWQDLGAYSQLNYNYDSKDTWFLFLNQAVTQGTKYKLRMYLDVLNKGKYDIALKPSTETIDIAITNNHFYLLDPWYSDDGINVSSNLVGYWNMDEVNGPLNSLVGGFTMLNTTGIPSQKGIINNSRGIFGSTSTYFETTTFPVFPWEMKNLQVFG
jgi:hypothetical protein